MPIGNVLFGSMNTTMCEKCGLAGKLNANWFPEIVWISVIHGLPGRMSENIVICGKIVVGHN